MDEELKEMFTVGKTEFFVLSALAGLAVYYVIFRRRAAAPIGGGLTQEDLDKLLQRRQQAAVNQRPSTIDANFVEKMKRTGKNIVIFYGSQTGTAEEFAVRLSKSAPKYGMKGLACDPEDVTDWDALKSLSEVDRGLAVFCLATYGEGEPTDNAISFNEWIKETEIDLTGVNFCVFGLGNKTYEHFNSMGTLADKQLLKLGATKFCDLGLGDDDQNIEDDFVQWQENVFWPAVCERFQVKSDGEFKSIRQFELEVLETTPERVFTGEPSRYQSFEKQRPPFEAKNPFLAPITTERKLNSNNDRYLMHIELDITESRMRYDAGDHIAILPTNQIGELEKLAVLLNVDLDTLFSLNNLDPDDTKRHPFPCPTTYRTAFLHYLDINSHPTTHLCRELAEYAASESDKEFLVKLSSNTPEGKEAFQDFIKRDNRSIVSVLESLPSVKIAADHLCELLPRLQVRYYSISSSAKVNPKSVHVTAVLVDYQTRTGRHVSGVCTKHLLDKAAGSDDDKKVACYIRKSQFRLPMKTSVPIILIGPGTGFAPFRGFLQEKQHQKNLEKPRGDVMLFYGCRKESEDYIYKDEVEAWASSGVITSLFTAFSRDGASKVYVQHRLAENGELVWNYLSRGAHIYVCGDAKSMARDVHACFEDIIMREANYTKEQAVQYLKNMSNKGRYSADVWS